MAMATSDSSGVAWENSAWSVFSGSALSMESLNLVCDAVEPLTLASIPQHVLLAMDLRLSDGRRVDGSLFMHMRVHFTVCAARSSRTKTHGASFADAQNPDSQGLCNTAAKR